nr:hypothetical protein [Chloroflexota bacterium]
ILSANTFTSAAKDLSNAGTITLGDANSGYSYLYGPGVTLTNSGQLNTIQGGGGARYLYLNITNGPTGTIDIAASDTQMGGGATMLTNNGTITIEATGSLALSGASFTQGSGGTFATTIDATTTAFGQLTAGGGPVSLGGKLKVTTIGSPAIAGSWPIISDANRSGQFETFDFGAINYDVQYPSTGVTLARVS